MRMGARQQVPPSVGSPGFPRGSPNPPGEETLIETDPSSGPLAPTGDSPRPAPSPTASDGAVSPRRQLAWMSGAATLGVALVVAVAGHAGLARADSSLASARTELAVTRAALSGARTGLATVEARSGAAGHALAVVSAQLAGDQARLARAQADQFDQGVSINQLDLCLAGVQKALNQIGLGDRSGAATTVTGVAGDCRNAEPPSP